jgi:hypothetical protein
LYLSYQKELSDKSEKYIDKFISYVVIFAVVLIYGKESSPLIITGLSLLFVFAEYKTHKKSMSAKLGFCLRLLKEVQAEKDES